MDRRASGTEEILGLPELQDHQETQELVGNQDQRDHWDRVDRRVTVLQVLRDLQEHQDPRGIRVKGERQVKEENGVRTGTEDRRDRKVRMDRKVEDL